MRINIWVYKDRRTSPGRIHRVIPAVQLFAPDGVTVLTSTESVIATVEILRESAADGREGIETFKVECQHVPTDWDDPKVQGWGPNGEWLGARGVLFMYEDDYPGQDPHEVFRAHEAVRAAGPPVKEVVAPVDAPVVEGNAPEVELSKADKKAQKKADKNK